MIAYIRQQLWVQQITYSAEPQSVLVDGVFVTYTLEISKGVAMWQFYSISATDWDGGYYDEETLDLSTLSSDQMREIINKADKSFDKVVGYYPQWKDYNIDLVDSEICFS